MRFVLMMAVIFVSLPTTSFAKFGGAISSALRSALKSGARAVPKKTPVKRPPLKNPKTKPKETGDSYKKLDEATKEDPPPETNSNSTEITEPEKKRPKHPIEHVKDIKPNPPPSEEEEL